MRVQAATAEARALLLGRTGAAFKVSWSTWKLFTAIPNQRSRAPTSWQPLLPLTSAALWV